MVIHEKFALRVASRYVDIYQRLGFKEAQNYLDFIVKGDTDLRDYLVPIIVEEGQRRK